MVIPHAFPIYDRNDRKLAAAAAVFSDGTLHGTIRRRGEFLTFVVFGKHYVECPSRCVLGKSHVLS
jgi:hypothetical protein